MIVFHTSHGVLSLELDFDRAPDSAANFLKYAKEGFYNGTIFHRVINDFMVQGGGYEPGMGRKPGGDPIANEANNGLSNILGSVAMARAHDDPHSASSQFFINVGDNLFLDHKGKSAEGWGYAVFGRVSKGMDVVRKISACKTRSRAGHQHVPVEDIVIESTEIDEPEKS